MTNQIWLRENEQRRALEHVLLFLIGYACLTIYQLDSQANVAAFRERSGDMSWLFKERLDHVADVDLHAEQEVSFPTDGAVEKEEQSVVDVRNATGELAWLNITMASSNCSADLNTEKGKRISANSRRTRTLVIVPFRNRWDQLKYFAPALTRFLAKQDIDFSIVVAEHTGKAKFNKGSLINVGFVEGSYMLQSATGDPNSYYDCVVIHDIDFIPVEDRNSYDCLRTPDVGAWQMSSAIDKYNWGLPNVAGVGGVGMATRQAFLLANGWSNRYFGWGGEDNDFFGRLSVVGKRMRRRCSSLGRYHALLNGHYRSPGVSVNRNEILAVFDRLQWREGLPTVQYRVMKRVQREYYLFVSVELWSNEEPDLVKVRNRKKRIYLNWKHLAYETPRW